MLLDHADFALQQQTEDRKFGKFGRVCFDIKNVINIQIFKADGVILYPLNPQAKRGW